MSYFVLDIYNAFSLANVMMAL